MSRSLLNHVGIVGAQIRRTMFVRGTSTEQREFLKMIMIIIIIIIKFYSPIF
jgi:hypothetical protein